MKLNHSVPTPTRARMAALRPRHPAVARACRYAAYTTQVMNAQTSLGSQFQYDDQSWCAQIWPLISTAKVQTGNPNATIRQETRSRVASDGRRATYPRSAPASRLSARDRTRY